MNLSNDSHVSFRASGPFVAALSMRAREAGCSLSEYLRSVIREHVGIGATSPVCENLAQAAFFTGDNSPYRSALARAPLREGEPHRDPFELLALAATGDTQAQRDLADTAILMALSGEPEVDPFVTLTEGLIFARLADRHDNVDDAMRIVSMLALGSTLATGIAARDMAGEAIARLEIIANGNSVLAESAAELLANCAERELAETMQIAKSYRDRLRETA